MDPAAELVWIVVGKRESSVLGLGEPTTPESGFEVARVEADEILVEDIGDSIRTQAHGYLHQPARPITPVQR